MTTKTRKLFTLTSAACKLDRPIVPFLIALVVFGLAGLLAFSRPNSAAPSAVAVPTPGLVILIATQRPVATPAGITVADARPVRYVTAWAAPGGNVLGPVPMPEMSALRVIRSDGWAMIEWDGGPKWLRVSDMGFDLADVSPERVIVVSAPAADQGLDQQPASDQPISDWYHDIATPEPAFVAAITQGEPNALACGGSPLCGGLTNQQAHDAIKASVKRAQ